MKNAIVIGIAVLFSISAFCDECWSAGFRFDGSEITEKAILLKPTDPLAYSSALAEGEPKSLIINVEDTTNPEISASIFADYSETAVEGTTTWDYTDEDFKDFPTDDTYLLTVKNPKVPLQRSEHTWLVDCPQRPGIELKTFDLITLFSIVRKIRKMKTYFHNFSPIIISGSI